MAIYHFSAKVISRANGSSALASSAYRAATRLYDERLDRHHDFSNKAGVVHSEVLLPNGAPEAWQDREKLWNAVEAAEVRKDAQLAREVEFAIPRELDHAEGIRLAREFVAREFVERGIVADLNVHWDMGSDGQPKPHAHVMLTMRAIEEDRFGPKVREWNANSLLEHWREAWADHVNERLAELDIDARVDHRSLEAQGIDLEPQHKIGPAASRMAAKGLDPERLAEHHAIARANGEKIIANPSLALDAITHHQATFTKRDLAMFVHRHSEGREQFEQVMAAVRASPDLIELGKDGRGEVRFTSREMLEVERRLERGVDALVERTDRGVARQRIDRALAASAAQGLVLGDEQRTALERLMRHDGLVSVIGYAGSGKSAMLGVARDAWEAEGYRVTGLALSGIAAENLEHGSGIASRTIASAEHQWAAGRDLLSSRDVLVIDEAGMVGARQMERVVREAQKRGAKLVLVGDAEQLQAIEAGAAFRSVTERHGSVEISEIRRQREGWQRNATRHLATGRTGEAILAYDEAGHVHPATTREVARASLIDRWDRDRQAAPEESRIILSHTRAEVAELNQAARERVRATGGLGQDVEIQTARGGRQFAAGDRIMFLRNERSLGVKNGTRGTIDSLNPTRMAVLLDDGRSVAFDTRDYADFDHGYAATIHKTQGMTVDRVHVLATPGLDRHATYVALSRHRSSVDLHYGQDEFADRGKLIRTLSRERPKDMASDHVRDFADRRQIIRLGRDVDQPTPEPKFERKSIFAGLRLPSEPQQRMLPGLRLDPTPSRPVGRGEGAALGQAVQRLARATADIRQTRQRGLSPLPHQQDALRKSRELLDNLKPHASHDLANAFGREASLVEDAAKGNTANAIRAMQLEAEIRTDPEKRADRFVEDFRRQYRAYERFAALGKERAAAAAQDEVIGMAKSLERDPQLESLVRQRKEELGIRVFEERQLSHTLSEWFDRSKDRGLSR